MWGNSLIRLLHRASLRRHHIRLGLHSISHLTLALLCTALGAYIKTRLPATERLGETGNAPPQREATAGTEDITPHPPAASRIRKPSCFAYCAGSSCACSTTAPVSVYEETYPDTTSSSHLASTASRCTAITSIPGVFNVALGCFDLHTSAQEQRAMVKCHIARGTPGKQKWLNMKCSARIMRLRKLLQIYRLRFICPGCSHTQFGQTLSAWAVCVQALASKSRQHA